VTRKDFVLIAGVLAQARNVESKAVVDRISLDFASELASTNRAFDRERFLTAARGES
jgi:hypothetical protein